MKIPPGPWDPVPSDQADLGILVLDGVLLRQAQVGTAKLGELVGAGDVLRPWPDAPHPDRHGRQPWTALEPTRVALLDRDVTAALGHWPELTAAVVERAVARSRRLGLQIAVCHMRRVDRRVLLMLWMLADRWGRVRGDGVLVPVRLTHKTLGSVVGAHRPTVTAAIKKLEVQGEMSRTDDGWLLRRERPEGLDDMYAALP